jgi:multiple sugar transport system substrate-binding protein
MRHRLGTSVLALAVGLMAGMASARADFWSDAGAKYKGVTLRGVTETSSKMYLRLSLRKRQGSK